MDIAEQIQFDLCDKLNGESYFADVPFVVVRNLVILEQIQKTLGSLQGKNNCVGLAGVVNPPDIIGVDGDALTAESVGIYTIDFIENPELNFGQTGTEITCLQGARQARAILQGFTMSGYTFYHDEGARVLQPIVNIKDIFPGQSGWRVELKVRLNEPAQSKCAAPSPSWNGDTLTLTNNQAGSAIYWTMDETFPGPGNYEAKQDGTQGTAQFTGGDATIGPLTPGTIIRFAAYFGSLIGSDVNQTTAP
jgi:hypothetical protein